MADWGTAAGGTERERAFVVFGDEALDAAFTHGFISGVERVRLTGSAPQPSELGDAMAPLAQALAARHAQTPMEPHAVALLAELTSVAASVRSAHGEPPLDAADIEDFLPAAIKFFNTYIGCANPQ